MLCRPSHDPETQNCVSDTSLGATCGPAGSACSCQYCSLLLEGRKKMLLPPDRKLEHTRGGHTFPWELCLGGRIGTCNWRGCRDHKGYGCLPSGGHDCRRKLVSSLGLCSQSTSQLLLNSQLPLMKWESFFLLISDIEKKTRINHLFQKADCYICKYDLRQRDVESNGNAFTGTQYKVQGKVNPLTILYAYLCCWATPQHPGRIVEDLLNLTTIGNGGCIQSQTTVVP